MRSFVNQGRMRNAATQGAKAASVHPPPGELDPKLILRELHGEQIRRHTGHEEAARDRRDLEAGHHEVVTDLLSGFTWLRPHHTADGTCDRHDDAAASGGDRRHRGRHDEVSETERIGDTGRAAAEFREHEVRDPLSETGLHEAKRQNVGRENEPHGAGREPREVFFERERPGEVGDRERDKHDRAGWKRRGEDTHNRRRENREHVHALGAQAIRQRAEPENEEHRERNRRSPPLRFRGLRLGCFITFCIRHGRHPIRKSARTANLGTPAPGLVRYRSNGPGRRGKPGEAWGGAASRARNRRDPTRGLSWITGTQANTCSPSRTDRGQPGYRFSRSVRSSGRCGSRSPRCRG